MNNQIALPIDIQSPAITAIEATRLRLSSTTEANKKSQFGQFLTPARTAQFMASLLPLQSSELCRLIDAGAGVGSLTCAFLDQNLPHDNIEVETFELDETLHPDLDHSLSQYRHKLPLTYTITGGDFIEYAVNRIQFGQCNFTHAILNPPYKKINSNSRHRQLLRAAGIETVNLYTAFVALTISLMIPGGQIVAIIPRSFCNGPYYRPFREFLLKRAAIKRMHLFNSRTQAFKDDDVLQENIIIHLERSAKQGPVTVSTSTDDTFSDLIAYEYPFDRIVSSADPERFIHVPTTPQKSSLELSSVIRHTLADLSINVSTGPIVDFRLQEYLRPMPEPGSVPILYPCHFTNGAAQWPTETAKKPNAILRNSETEKWLLPNDFYCVVRRFSSKEERRRIVASVVDPNLFKDFTVLGFENHLNVFHANKHGLPQELAHGLAAFLNATAVDENFRSFNGHTQVNATDLKTMKYPSRQILIELGKWAMHNRPLTQEMIDQKINEIAS